MRRTYNYYYEYTHSCVGHTAEFDKTQGSRPYSSAVEDRVT